MPGWPGWGVCGRGLGLSVGVDPVESYGVVLIDVTATYCNGEACGEERDYDEQGNLVRIIRFDANGDAESVQEITPGRKPRKKS